MLEKALTKTHPDFLNHGFRSTYELKETILLLERLLPEVKKPELIEEIQNRINSLKDLL